MNEPKEFPPLNEPASGGLPQNSEGWSPYEVWRTRILLPRLEEERQKKAERLIVKDGQEILAVRRPLAKRPTILARALHLFA